MVAARLNQAERPGRDHYVILGLSWAGWLFDFYDLILYSFLLVPVAREFGLTREQSSLVLGVSLGCTAVGGIIFGRLADRFGRKAVLQWTILSYSAGVFLSGLALGLWTLLAARIITAVGVGGEWATGQTIVSETFPARRRGHYGALMQTGAPLGVGLAAIMGSFFAPAFGWRTTFIVSALPALLVTLIRKHMPESDVWEARRAELDAVDHLRKRPSRRRQDRAAPQGEREQGLHFESNESRTVRAEALEARSWHLATRASAGAPSELL